MKKVLTSVLAALLALSVVFINVGCMKMGATDLMRDITRKEVDGKNPDDEFKSAYLNFTAELFKKSVGKAKNDGEGNALISPFSVMVALSMTANGAGGNTLSEMENVIGKNIDIETLNKYLYTYIESLYSGEKCKLSVANSIWLRDTTSLSVKKNFLQKNMDYYNAAIYKSMFDAKGANDINSWVKKHTDGMIEKLVDKIDDETMMLLINAVAFDAEWSKKYDVIYEGNFTSFAGDRRTVDMMRSVEEKYIDDGGATGFIKEYKGGKYSFAAILPNSEDIYSYVENMTEGSIEKLLSGVSYEPVKTEMPKFSSDFSITMEECLKEMGIKDAFSSIADFSEMAENNLSISRVIHKTHITVNEKGTKAAAVTGVTMTNTAVLTPATTKEVVLDRPFVYMILDNENNMPVFIGMVTDIK